VSVTAITNLARVLGLGVFVWTTCFFPAVITFLADLKVGVFSTAFEGLAAADELFATESCSEAKEKVSLEC